MRAGPSRVAAGLAAGLLVVLAVGSPKAPATITLHGTLDLLGPTAFDEQPVVAVTHDNSCYGALSYGDLDVGARVTVLAGTAQLGSGSLCRRQTDLRRV